MRTTVTAVRHSKKSPKPMSLLKVAAKTSSNSNSNANNSINNNNNNNNNNNRINNSLPTSFPSSHSTLPQPTKSNYALMHPSPSFLASLTSSNVRSQKPDAIYFIKADRHFKVYYAHATKPKPLHANAKASTASIANVNLKLSTLVRQDAA